MPYVPGQMRRTIMRSPFLSYLMGGRSGTQLARAVVSARTTGRRGRTRRAAPRFRSAVGMRQRSSRGANTSYLFPAVKRTTHSLIFRHLAPYTHINETSDNDNVFRFHAASMWRSRLTGGPTYNYPSAHGWSLMSTLYDHYFVESATLVLTAQNNTDMPIQMGICLNDQINIESQLKYMYKTEGVQATLPTGAFRDAATSGYIPAGIQKTISYTYNPKKFFGVSTVWNESKLRARYDDTSAGLPPENATFHVWFSPHGAHNSTPNNPTAGELSFTVKITYRVRSVEPKILDTEPLEAPPP